MSHEIKPGRYVCDGQAPIIVIDEGQFKDGFHGPWIRYRFPWETEEQVKAKDPVIFTTFLALLDFGYRLDPSE